MNKNVRDLSFLLTLVVIAFIGYHFHKTTGLIVIGIVLWLFALISVLSRRDMDIHAKLTWVVTLLLLNGLGGLLNLRVFDLSWTPFLNGLGGLIYFFFAPSSTARRRTSVPCDTTVPSECLSCRGIVPSGKDRCPTCGWTYNE